MHASPHAPHEWGIALLVTLFVILVLVSMTGALIPLTSTQSRIAANHRRAAQGLYAAEAVLAWTVEELRHVPSWRAVSVGSHRSSFIVWSRQRRFPDGTVWNLDNVAGELERNGSGPSGAGRGHRWRLYAFGPLDRLVPRDPTGGLLIVAVWVAEVGTLVDVALVLHAAAAGPGHARRAVQATVRRAGVGHQPVVASWALVQ